MNVTRQQKKMSPIKHSSSLILLSCILLAASTAAAHNITLILEKYPDFSTFNGLLSKTKLAEEINKRKTITVLAIPNDKIGDLSGKQEDTMKSILMNHIVLDYYDILKLQKMKEKSNILTTLYQTTGVASYSQGFLNVTEMSGGKIVFGSAVKGAPLDCQYVGTVASQPYNISVLSVSHPIVAPGIDGMPLRPVAAPGPKPSAAAAPPTTDSAPSPAKAEAPVVDAPTPAADDASTPPPEAAAPAPASSPAPAAADASPADADSKAETPKSSAGKNLMSCYLVLTLVFASILSFQY